MKDIQLVTTDQSERVNILTKAKFERESGKIHYKGVEDLQPGRYYIEMRTKSNLNLKSSTCGAIEIKKPAKFNSLSYKLSNELLFARGNNQANFP
jgi:hypothetical protein